MKAVITVIGKDTVGILAGVSNECAKCNANILEVTQSVMQDMFAMIMMVEISECSVPFTELSNNLCAEGDRLGVKVHVIHEDLFNSMHRI